MKRMICVFSLVAMLFSLTACGDGEQSGGNVASDVASLSSQADSTTTSSKTETNNEIDPKSLKQGDEVSIVGQVASVPIEGVIDSVDVQTQRQDGRWCIYKCTFKPEFDEQVKNLKSLDIAKVKGLFLSVTDMEMENTAILVTLYDCELLS